ARGDVFSGPLAGGVEVDGSPDALGAGNLQAHVEARADQQRPLADQHQPLARQVAEVAQRLVGDPVVDLEVIGQLLALNAPTPDAGHSLVVADTRLARLLQLGHSYLQLPGTPNRDPARNGPAVQAPSAWIQGVFKERRLAAIGVDLQCRRRGATFVVNQRAPTVFSGSKWPSWRRVSRRALAR